MSIKRTPFKILLIEQLCISLCLSALVFLSIVYGHLFLFSVTNLETEDAAMRVIIKFLFFVIFSWLYIYLPFTCMRIWVSAAEKLQGTARRLFQVYSCLCATLIALSVFPFLTFLSKVFV